MVADHAVHLALVVERTVRVLFDGVGVGVLDAGAPLASCLSTTGSAFSLHANNLLLCQVTQLVLVRLLLAGAVDDDLRPAAATLVPLIFCE